MHFIVFRVNVYLFLTLHLLIIPHTCCLHSIPAFTCNFHIRCVYFRLSLHRLFLRQSCYSICTLPPAIFSSYLFLRFVITPDAIFTPNLLFYMFAFPLRLTICISLTRHSTPHHPCHIPRTLLAIPTSDYHFLPLQIVHHANSPRLEPHTYYYDFSAHASYYHFLHRGSRTPYEEPEKRTPVR